MSSKYLCVFLNFSTLRLRTSFDEAIDVVDSLPDSNVGKSANFRLRFLNVVDVDESLGDANDGRSANVVDPLVDASDSGLSASEVSSDAVGCGISPSATVRLLGVRVGNILIVFIVTSILDGLVYRED